MIWVRRLMLTAALPALIAAGAAGISGCETARRSEPLTAIRPEPPSEHLRAGQVAFMRNCHECHPNGAAGVGPAINDKPLPPAAMKLQIRLGAGKMPAFSKEKLPDAEAERIVEYLVWMRTARGAPRSRG